MSKTTPKLKILSHQAEFIQSKFRHTGLVGGFRSGKSHAGILKTVLKKLELPGINCAYYLPSYDLIDEVALVGFEKFFNELGVEYEINHTKRNIYTEYGKIICRSMSRPERIIGYEVGYSLIDEADVPAKDKMIEVMRAVLARNSAKVKDCINATDFVSTPEGFKFLYDFFVKNKSKDKHLIRAKTQDNPFISESYIQSLLDQYTAERVLAYLEGQFVNLASGTVYYAFNRRQHATKETINPKELLHIGMDFNVEHMAAVVYVIRQGKLLAVDELVSVYDTFQMIKLLKEKFPAHPVFIYPDASGDNRNSSGATDHKLLKKAGFRVMAPKKNPAIKDRVNVLNLGFQKDKIFVNVDNCPFFVEALEQQPYNEHGQPDKTTGHDHVNDAGGYATHHIFNVKKLIPL